MTTTVTTATPRDRVLTKNDVLAMFAGIANSTLYGWVKQKRFPAPIKIGLNRVGWLQSEIDAHIARLKIERDTQRAAQRETEAA